MTIECREANDVPKGQMTRSELHPKDGLREANYAQSAKKEKERKLKHFQHA